MIVRVDKSSRDCHIDPKKVARDSRERIVGPYKGELPDEILQSMEEQLSGASC